MNSVVLKAIIASIVISTVLLIASPIIAVILLQLMFVFTDITGLPQSYANGFPLFLLTLIAIVSPGILANINLTKNEPFPYRLGSIAIYLLILFGIGFLIVDFVFNDLSGLGQL